MALFPCPECRREISEYAESCPQCGYTLESGEGTRRRKRWHEELDRRAEEAREAKEAKEEEERKKDARGFACWSVIIIFFILIFLIMIGDC